MPSHVRIPDQVVKSWVRYSKLSAKFEFRYERLKSKFSFENSFCLQLMIGCSKKNRDIVVIRQNPFEQKQKNRKRKFNRELALIGLRAILSLHDGASPVSKCIMRLF